MRFPALCCCAISVLAFFGANAAPQSNAGASKRLERVQALYSGQKWDEAAREAQGPPDQAPDFDYYAGMSLARLARWNEAREAFSRGARKAPRDARFLTERAGAEYKLNDFRAAKRDLQKALRLARHDSYTLEFLGTIYLLEGNLEAALRYWNRIEKPKLASVEVSPPAKTNTTLLDRAVAFSPPTVFERGAMLKTEALLENLDVFPKVRIDLSPPQDAQSEEYAATLQLTERKGLGATPLQAALSLFSGVPYDTAYPAWYGFGGTAVNFTSLTRWDSEKRRLTANLEFPLFQQPSKRLQLFFDARNENWNLSQTFFAAPSFTDLNVQRFAGGAEFHLVESGWWDWTAAIEVTSRQFRNVPAGLPSNAVPFFTDTSSLDARLGVHRWLLRVPERRFTLQGAGELRGGRNYANGLGAFASIKGDVTARWLPQAQGDDWEFTSRLRAGDTFGDVPLDMLYELGVERDNDLWLRGHDATIGGRKGRAPLGRRYLLSNSEWNKTVYNGGFFRIQLGTFFDTGAVADPSGFFGSQKWLFDTGLQARLRVLGSLSVAISYGRDLRNGKGLFFATSVP